MRKDRMERTAALSSMQKALEKAKFDFERELAATKYAARLFGIPEDVAQKAIAAELELEYERGRTTIGVAEPIKAIARVRARICAGDRLD